MASNAAAADEDPSVRADRLFREAEAFFDFGDIPRACATWADSLRMQPKLGTLLNLALCHETMGRIATAWKEYHYGAAWAAQNGQKDRQKFAHEHASQLEPRLPRVALQLAPDQTYSTIEIDGEPLPEPEWVLPFYLDPGAHTIAVTAPGKKRKTIPINVTSAPSSQQVAIGDLEDLERAAPPAPTYHLERTWMTTAGIATTGAGLATLAVSLFFGFSAADGRDDLRSRCNGNRCVATGIQAYKDVQTNATLSTWLAVSGAVVTGVGVGLIVYDPKKNTPDVAPVKPAPARARTGTSTVFRLAPVIGGAGMFAEGRF